MVLEGSTMKLFLSWALVGVSVVCVVTCGGNVVVDPPRAVAMGGSTVSGNVGSTGSSIVGFGGSIGTGCSNCGGGSTIGCTSDADCLAGETCDVSTGVCVGMTGSGCHQCACVDILSTGGCGDICDMAQNGTSTPNFCNGVSALPQCAKCLLDRCGNIPFPPNPTDPSACM
jgi:hypothetical protein